MNKPIQMDGKTRRNVISKAAAIVYLALASWPETMVEMDMSVPKGGKFLKLYQVPGPFCKDAHGSNGVGIRSLKKK